VQRIWDHAPHNAFTDLIRFDGRFICTFREGSDHVPGENGTDGRIRVISSRNGDEWESVALLEKEGLDLRDPKISITPDGRLMVVMGGSNYDGRELVDRHSYVSFSNQVGREFSLPQPVSIDPEISQPNDWLWRVTWYRETAYGVVYQANEEGEWNVHLVRSSNGTNYSLVSTLDIPRHPNESTIRFRDDHRAVMVVRREGGNHLGYLGFSDSPYSSWNWRQISYRLGGPNLKLLNNGSMVLATRHYKPDDYSTVVGILSRNGTFTNTITVPSGGDTSYPGLLVYDDQLWMSYYSSHEEKTAIYLATIPLRSLTSS
jgi:hypothetical protein